MSHKPAKAVSFHQLAMSISKPIEPILFYVMCNSVIDAKTDRRIWVREEQGAMRGIR